MTQDTEKSLGEGPPHTHHTERHSEDATEMRDKYREIRGQVQKWLNQLRQDESEGNITTPLRSALYKKIQKDLHKHDKKFSREALDTATIDTLSQANGSIESIIKDMTTLFQNLNEEEVSPEKNVDMSKYKEVRQHSEEVRDKLKNRAEELQKKLDASEGLENPQIEKFKDEATKELNRIFDILNKLEEHFDKVPESVYKKEGEQLEADVDRATEWLKHLTERGVSLLYPTKTPLSAELQGYVASEKTITENEQRRVENEQVRSKKEESVSDDFDVRKIIRRLKNGEQVTLTGEQGIEVEAELEKKGKKIANFSVDTENRVVTVSGITKMQGENSETSPVTESDSLAAPTAAEPAQPVASTRVDASAEERLRQRIFNVLGNRTEFFIKKDGGKGWQKGESWELGDGGRSVVVTWFEDGTNQEKRKKISAEKFLKILEHQPANPAESAPTKKAQVDTASEMAGLTKEQIIAKYLSYQDAKITAQLKKEGIEGNLKNPNAHKYAEALKKIFEIEKKERVDTLVEKIKQSMESTLQKIGIESSVFGKSDTWAYWDLAKQFHFFTHKNEQKGDYEIGNPFESEKKYAEIVDRHIGWEVYGAAKTEGESFLDKFDQNKPSFKKIKNLLGKKAKSDVHTLSSKDLAELGGLIRENVGVLVALPKKEKTPEQNPSAGADVPVSPSIKTPEKKDAELEKKDDKKRNIIDLRVPALEKILGNRIADLKRIKNIFVEHGGGDIISAKLALEQLFVDADPEELSALLKKSGFTNEEFLKSWRDRYIDRVIEAMKTDVEYKRTKEMERQRSWYGAAGDWMKAQLSGARAWQVALRGITVGGGYLLGSTTSRWWGADLDESAGIGGALGGLGRWAMSGWEKLKNKVTKADEKAFETTLKNKEEIRQKRMESEAVTAGLEKALAGETPVELFGMIAGVLREESFEELTDTKERVANSSFRKIDHANQALLQQHYYERIAEEIKNEMASKVGVVEGDEKKKEAEKMVEKKKLLMEKRVDAAIAGLYADETDKYAHALEEAIKKQPSLIKVLKKINEFKNVDFNALLKKDDHGHGHDDHGGHGDAHGSHGHDDHGHGGHHGPSSGERWKAAGMMSLHALGGASIAVALRAEPGVLRAVFGALGGAYLGGTIGMELGKLLKEKKFEKEILEILEQAESVLEKSKGGVSHSPDAFSGVAMNTRVEWAKQIRMALNFGILKEGTNRWYVANTVLREIERTKYEEVEKNAQLEKLFGELEKDFQSQQKEQWEKREDLEKVSGWWKWGGMVVGAASLGTIGYFWGNRGRGGEEAVSAKENIKPLPVAPAAAGSLEGSQGSMSRDTIAPISKTEPIGPAPERVVTEEVKVYAGEIGKGEGVLHGANRAIDKAIEAGQFKIEGNLDNKISPAELREWKINELKKMGFVFEKGKWGYPFTVHKGAEVVVYTDEKGNAHLRVVGSDKEITKHEFIKFKDVRGADSTNTVDQEQLERARKISQRFEEEVNKFSKPDAPAHVGIRVDEELSMKIGVNNGHLEGMVGAKALPSGGVSLELESGRMIGAYAVPDRSFEAGSDLDPTESHWTLKPIEYAPGNALPDEIEGRTAKARLTDSNRSVTKSDAIMTREQHTKWMQEHGTPKKSSVPNSSEPVPAKRTEVSPDTKTTPTEEKVPTKNTERVEVVDVQKKHSELKEAFFAPSGDSVHTTIISAFRRISEFQSFKAEDVDSFTSALKQGYDRINEAINKGAFDTLTQEEFEKEAVKLLRPDARILSYDFNSDPTLIYEDADGRRGKAFVGSVKLSNGDYLSYMRLREDGGRESLIPAPDGWFYTDDGGKAVLRPVTGEGSPQSSASVR